MTLQNTYSRQAEIDSNDYEERVLTGQIQPVQRRTEIVPDSKVDSLTTFYTKHELRRTAPKQGRLLAQTIRQGELISCQAELGMRVYNNLSEHALGYMLKLSQLEEKCEGRVPANVAERVSRMVDRGLDIQEHLPTAAVQRYLRSQSLD